MGNPSQLQQLGQPDQNRLLADPQQLNSYNYGRNNPITQKDPLGLALWQAGGGFSAGPLGLNVGVRWEPGVGWQFVSSYSAGLSVGASVQYDPNGHLDLQTQRGDTNDTIEIDFVPLIGGHWTKSTKQNNLNPLDFSNSSVDKGWAFGFQFGAQYAIEHEGAINYSNPQHTGSSNPQSNVAHTSQSKQSSGSTDILVSIVNQLQAIINNIRSYLQQTSSQKK